MIEFLAVTGKRYPIEFRKGNVFVIVNHKDMITRHCYKTRMGYEICYGGHFIEGKLRVKAGRRVVPPARKAIEVKLSGFHAARFCMSCMDSGLPINHLGDDYKVLGVQDSFGTYYATLIPWVDPT